MSLPRLQGIYLPIGSAGDSMSDRSGRTSVSNYVVNALCRPLIAMWLQTAEMSDPQLPRPDRIHDGEAPTHHSDRVLLVGNGAAVGYGVLTHDLSLAGNLGRQLTTLTGRTTYVTVLADGGMTAGSALTALRDADLEPYDAIVTTVGLNEALGLSSTARWRREVDELVEFVLSPAAPRLQLFLVGVPPIDSVTAVPRLVRWATDRHSLELNAHLAAACAGDERVTFVPFAPGPAPDITRYRGSETYREWALLIADPIARGLDHEHPDIK